MKIVNKSRFVKKTFFTCLIIRLIDKSILHHVYYYFILLIRESSASNYTRNPKKKKKITNAELQILHMVFK